MAIFQSELPHRAKSIYMYLTTERIKLGNVIWQLVPLGGN